MTTATLYRDSKKIYKELQDEILVPPDISKSLEEVCKNIEEELESDFVAIQWINEKEKVIEAVFGIASVGLSRHYLYPEETNEKLRDIQADIVETFNTEIIAGYDPRFDQGIYQEEQFRHASMVRIFTPIFTPILVSNDPTLNSDDWFDRLEPQVDKNCINEKWFKEHDNHQLKDNGQHTIIKVNKSAKSNFKAVGTIEVGYKNPENPIDSEKAIQLIKYVCERAEEINKSLTKINKYPEFTVEIKKKRKDTFKSLLDITVDEVLEDVLYDKLDKLYDQIASTILNILAADIVIIYKCNDNDDSQKESVDQQFSWAGKMKNDFRPQKKDINVCSSFIRKTENDDQSNIDVDFDFKQLSFGQSEGIKSAAAILLKSKNEEDPREKTVGVMFIFYRRNYDFSKEKNYIVKLTDIAAEAIAQLIKNLDAELIKKVNRLQKSRFLSTGELAEFAYKIEKAKKRGELNEKYLKNLIIENLDLSGKEKDRYLSIKMNGAKN